MFSEQKRNSKQTIGGYLQAAFFLFKMGNVLFNNVIAFTDIMFSLRVFFIISNLTEATSIGRR